MNNLIVFDFKNTLMDSRGRWLSAAKRNLKLAKNSPVELMLYTVNEPWSLEALARESSTFEMFDSMLLVVNKRLPDLAMLSGRYRRILVVGDSKTEELASAQELDFDWLDVSEGTAWAAFPKLLKEFCDD